jgi:hypothetical protein
VLLGTRPKEKGKKKVSLVSLSKPVFFLTRNRNDSFVENVNYYAESEDLLAANGTSLTWESRGQMRFS